ncbi:MAG: glycosyltransferase [Dysgonamonadaceae bacterium]|jgi:glycosyltransferase involved in cell wall biosynthesis|nr:glycosyltransferase [Dysgonamonadaceae bacterium]
MPQVSIIIPNYNHAAYLKERIESILNQTYTDYEIILMDDCSTDNSREIIESYRSHPKVGRILYNEQNSGSPFRQWERGIEAAQGRFLWIAESDDTADPHFLETLIPCLFNDYIAIAYCQSNRMSAEGMITGNWADQTNKLYPKQFESDFCMKGAEFIDRYLLQQNVIPNASAVLFRKSACQAVGNMDTTIKKCGDWLFWLKLLTVGNVCFCAQSLNNYRYHTDSVIARAAKEKVVQIFEYNCAMRQAFGRYLQASPGSGQTSFLIRKNREALIKAKIYFCYQWFNSERNSHPFKKLQLYICSLKQQGVLRHIAGKYNLSLLYQHFSGKKHFEIYE